jgi:hypothetical protein
VVSRGACATKGTPLDAKTKKPLPHPEWTLRPYIDVAPEIGWITHSGKDVAAVLRDYRNYIHPEKERSHAITPTEDDSAMLWEVTKSLAPAPGVSKVAVKHEDG